MVVYLWTFVFFALEIKSFPVVSPFMQNMMGLCPERCALVHCWEKHRIKYSAIILRNRKSGRWGSHSLKSCRNNQHCHWILMILFVNSGQIYFLFTEIVPFFSLQAVPNVYMCLPYKWPCVESPLQAMWGKWKEGDSQFHCLDCSWESNS